jgi:hypothetical protein
VMDSSDVSRAISLIGDSAIYSPTADSSDAPASSFFLLPPFAITCLSSLHRVIRDIHVSERPVRPRAYLPAEHAADVTDTASPSQAQSRTLKMLVV